MKWFICSLFLGRHQLWKKIISGIYVINAPRGRLYDRGRLTQNSIQRGVSIRYGAFIGSWAFIRSFTVLHLLKLTDLLRTLRVRKLHNESREYGGEHF